MSRVCRVKFARKTVAVRAGDRLLDAALKAGVAQPHPCQTVPCDACRLRVVKGDVLGGETSVWGVVRACHAVVLSDLEVEVAPSADVASAPEVGGEVVAIRLPSRDVAEVTIATARPFVWSAGQSASFRFDGFPARVYCPTVALDGRDLPGTFRLHIQLIPGGVVSSAIGRGIKRGHRVAIEASVGANPIPLEGRGRIALFSKGTGFAPAWAIADRVLREAPGRPLLLVVGVRAITAFYMAEALERLARCPNVAVVPVVEEPQSLVPHIETGRVSDLAHLIGAGDAVFAGGDSSMVETLRAHAARVGVPFNAHPFDPVPPETEGWMTRVAERFGASRRRPAVAGHSTSRARAGTSA